MPRKPTEKQTKFVAHLAANPEATLQEAGEVAGYAPATIHNASANIVDRPGVVSVIEQFRATAHQRLNDEFILNKIEQQMDAKKWVNSYTEPDKYVEDWDARDKGIKNALRVRGFDEGGNTLIQNNVNYGELKDRYKK